MYSGISSRRMVRSVTVATRTNGDLTRALRPRFVGAPRMQILRVCEPDHTPPRVQDYPRFACDCGRREGLSTPGRRAVMSIDSMARQSKDGLTLMLYRGEDMVLMAFDIDESLRKPDFVGFGIQYRIGSDPTLHDVFNFLTFKALREKAEAETPDPDDGKKAGKKPKAAKTAKSKTAAKVGAAGAPASAPPKPVDFSFKATMRPPIAKATVEATIDIGSATRGNFLNVGFTRGFASSQAYARTFRNNPAILPGKKQREIEFDTKPFEPDGQPYPWLGFEARSIMLSFLDEGIA